MKKSGRLTLIICLDSFRYDYVSEKDTPFLAQLADEGVYRRLKNIMGFNANLATMYTGCYPKTHNIWTMFWYDPSKSAFRWFNGFSSVLRTVDKIRKVRQPTRNSLALVTNMMKFAAGSSSFGGVYEIPIDYLRLFDFAQKNNFCEKGALCVPTIFDILYENRVKNLAMDWLITSINGNTRISPKIRFSDNKECDQFISYIKGGQFRVASLHLYELDQIIHENGPKSSQATRKIRELDYLLENIVRKVQKIYDELDIVIFSDHGATKIRKTLNIISKLELGFNHNVEQNNFYTFLDSTMARFWFRDNSSRNHVISVLSKLSDGHFLHEDEKRDYGLNFHHHKYGQEIFLANPGVLISPNFFQGSQLVQGMHGYDPSFSEMDALAIFQGNRVVNDDLKGSINATEWLPILLGILGLNIPTTCEGSTVQTKKLIKSV